MAATHRQTLPHDLRRARQRFQDWRRQRQAGRRIPARLWRLAVRLVRRHGLARTAAALRLDYYSLKNQVAATDARPTPPSRPPFIELAAPVPLGKQAHVVIDHGDRTLRLHLVGYEAADLETLCRCLRSGD